MPICNALILNFKAPSISVAYKILTFSEKIKLGIWCELSAVQTIHNKCQALFSLKNKSKNT